VVVADIITLEELLEAVEQFKRENTREGEKDKEAA
jgi:hypothetical protein